jgi:hypothetical protein
MAAALDPEQAQFQAFGIFEQLVPPSVLDEFESPHRGVYSTWVVVWLMTFQRLHRNASLSRAVAELKLGAVARALPDCKRVRDDAISVGTGGYSQARSSLAVEAAVRVVDHLFATLAAAQRPAWRGRRAYLLDGTTVALTHHPELLERFPPSENQHGRSHWPIVNLVTAHDLDSGVATRPEWGPMYGPAAVGEARLARDVLGRLGGPALIVADRNFGIFSAAHAATGLGHDVVMRLKDDRFGRMVAEASPIGPGSWRLSWRPSRWDRRTNPDLPADAVVHGRLIETIVDHEGERIVLRVFTTEATASAEEVAALYKRRWCIESDIRDVKQTMQLHRLSGRSVEMAAKEILLGSVAYNLVNQVRRLAARRGGVEPRRLSFRRVMDLYQAYVGGLNPDDAPDRWEERFERLLTSAAQCRLPLRKRFRSYPRELVPRSRGFPDRKRRQ